MPASIFHGAISFGLVSVPITVLSSTQNHAVCFRQIHTADHGLVRNSDGQQRSRKASRGEPGGAAGPPLAANGRARKGLPPGGGGPAEATMHPNQPQA